MDNKYVLGLDIGISSCGYGIIDLETGKFVDYGVRFGTMSRKRTHKIDKF